MLEGKDQLDGHDDDRNCKDQGDHNLQKRGDPFQKGAGIFFMSFS